MDGNCCIQVRDVKKSFKIYYDKGNTIKERAVNRGRKRYEERRVLDGISFDICKGEAVGLIGSNGCGKSTTLKLLTKIIFPDEGKIEINGRVSSLLELGAGFHPDMSGRENIYTNAAIFGLKKCEIDQRMDDIIRFSELEDFIDNPVRTYSSGMYMRLAFSVAINVNADILLIDEILAVGDVSFQKKCIDKIIEIKNAGTTIVLVSHSMGQIEQICDKAIWLEEGRVKEIGDAKVVDAHYQDQMEEKRLIKIREQQREKDSEGYEDEASIFNKLTIRNGNGKVKFFKVWLEDTKGNAQEIFGIRNRFSIKAAYGSTIAKTTAIMSFAITRRDGVLCYATNSDINGQYLELEEKGEIAVEIKENSLLKGEYMLNIAIMSREGEVYDDLQRVLFFSIDSTGEEQGICQLKCEWKQ